MVIYIRIKGNVNVEKERIIQNRIEGNITDKNRCKWSCSNNNSNNNNIKMRNNNKNNTELNDSKNNDDLHKQVNQDSNG